MAACAPCYPQLAAAPDGALGGDRGPHTPPTGPVVVPSFVFATAALGHRSALLDSALLRGACAYWRGVITPHLARGPRSAPCRPCPSAPLGDLNDRRRTPQMTCSSQCTAGWHEQQSPSEAVISRIAARCGGSARDGTHKLFRTFADGSLGAHSSRWRACALFAISSCARPRRRAA